MPNSALLREARAAKRQYSLRASVNKKPPVAGRLFLFTEPRKVISPARHLPDLKEVYYEQNYNHQP